MVQTEVNTCIKINVKEMMCDSNKQIRMFYQRLWRRDLANILETLRFL